MHNLPKWLSALFFAGLWGILYAFKIMVHSVTTKKWINGYIIIVIVSCGIQALFGFFQTVESIIYSYIGQRQICGSFDTVSGYAGCLCAGIPLFLIGMKSKSQYIRCITKVLLTIVIITIFVSKSRSGIISVSLLFGYWIIFKHQISKRVQYAIIGGIICLFTCCYFLKKDSANGRVLIWNCCWEMIKDKPLLGHGWKAFDIYYMNYQSAYFSKNPESRFILLADNVKHTYNEYLSLGIQFGMIGWGFLLVLIFLLRHCYKKNPSLKAQAAILSLVSISLFSFFSYPFEYIFIWIIFLLDIAIIISEAYPYQAIKNIFGRLSVSIVMVGASLFLIHHVHLRICSEIEWNIIADYAHQGQMRKVSHRYQKLMSSLGKNPKFLYNYAAELYMIGEYKNSIAIAKQCRRYYADYDLELLLAMNAIKTNSFKNAEKYLQSAFLMCPNRFIPLFELAKLYEKDYKINKAMQIATIILNKKVKINSPTIHSIKIEMRCLLEKHKAKSEIVPSLTLK